MAEDGGGGRQRRIQHGEQIVVFGQRTRMRGQQPDRLGRVDRAAAPESDEAVDAGRGTSEMTELLEAALRSVDAPDEQFARLGLG